MSRDNIVAKRYAKALFELSQSHDQIAQTETDLKFIVETVSDNAGFGKLLAHPNIDLSQKLALLNKTFTGNVSEFVLNTVSLLVERRREDLLADLLEYYVRIANETLGQAKAFVTTPLAITAEESEQISRHFSTISGKKIQVDLTVDPQLLGGLKVRIGDRLYDGSLSGKLLRLEKTLKVSQAL